MIDNKDNSNADNMKSPVHKHYQSPGKLFFPIWPLTVPGASGSIQDISLVFVVPQLIVMLHLNQAY